MLRTTIGVTQSRASRQNVVIAKRIYSSSVLFISTVWPERSSSAAGVRTTDLIEACNKRWHYKSFYACSATPNAHSKLLNENGVQTFHILPNIENQLTELLLQLQPEVVVFDRFYSEEAFSFRVRQVLPNSLRVLDMQDIHFLRGFRESMVAKKYTMSEILAARPNSSESDNCLRELSSIYRSDLTLVCSPVELDILTKDYNIPRTKVHLAPFFVPPNDGNNPDMSSRSDFLMIGNWRHAPNADAAKWTVEEVWPLIQKELKEHKPKLRIYGAHPTGLSTSLHRPSKGVESLGFAPNLGGIMRQHSVLLAPLRFGAGLKGKIVDAWMHGLPVVTTPIGAEGMVGRGGVDSWGGVCTAESAREVAAAAVELYTNPDTWIKSQQAGYQLNSELYDKDQRLNAIKVELDIALEQLEGRRQRDFIGAILWREGNRSTEYFSRWIELKESKLVER